jgi:hypothetical protein
MTVKPKSSKPTENSVEAQVLEFMQARSWRATRNHVGKFRTQFGGWISVGVEHFPDWSFSRGTGKLGVCELLHFEAKAPGKKPNGGQLEKLASLNAIGERAFWASSLLMFTTLYYQGFSDAKP